MAITLSKPVSVSVTVQQPISTVTVERYADIPPAKEVRVFLRELQGPIVLWSGADYDAIGDWTEAQAEAKIIDILSKK